MKDDGLQEEAGDFDHILRLECGNEASGMLCVQNAVPKIAALASPPQPLLPPSAPPASPTRSGSGGRGEVHGYPLRPYGTAVSSTSAPAGGGRGGFRTSPHSEVKQVRRSPSAHTSNGYGHSDDVEVATLKEYWRSVLRDEASADVRLAAGSHVDGSPSTERLHAHRLVLSRIPFFRRLFASQARKTRTQASSKDVVVRGVTHTALRRVLLYVYTDDAFEAVAGTLERPGDLLTAADVCGLPMLRAACEDMLIARQASTSGSCEFEADELTPELNVIPERSSTKQVEELADENERLRGEVNKLRSCAPAFEVVHESARSLAKSLGNTRLNGGPPRPPLAEAEGVRGDGSVGYLKAEVEDGSLDNIRALSGELQAQLVEIERLRNLLKQRNGLPANAVFHTGQRDSCATDSTVALGSAFPSSIGSPRSAISPSIAMEITRQIRQLRAELELSLKDELLDSVREQLHQELQELDVAGQELRRPNSIEATATNGTSVLRLKSDSPPRSQPIRLSSGEGTAPVCQPFDITTEVDCLASVQGSAVLPRGSLHGSAVLPIGNPTLSALADRPVSMNVVQAELPQGIATAAPKRSVSPIVAVARGRAAATSSTSAAWVGAHTVVRRSTPHMGQGAVPPPPTRQASAVLGATGPSRSRSGTPIATTAAWRGSCPSVPSRNSPSRIRVASRSSHSVASHEVISHSSSIPMGCSGSVSLPMATAASRQSQSSHAFGTAMLSGGLSAPTAEISTAASIPRLVGPFPKVTWQYYQMQPDALDRQSRSRSGSPAPIEGDNASSLQPPIAVVSSIAPATERNRVHYRQNQSSSAVGLSSCVVGGDSEHENPTLA